MLLLARGDVNPDKPDDEDITPLQCASRYEYKGVVRLLLAWGAANPDKLGNDGITPL